MKRRIAFKRRIVGWFSLLLLHVLTAASGGAMAGTIGPTVGVAAPHCAERAATMSKSPSTVVTMAMPMKAMLVMIAATDTGGAADCGGCCKTQHSCAGLCACVAPLAAFTWGIDVTAVPATSDRLHFTAINPPPESPLRIFRPPIV